MSLASSSCTKHPSLASVGACALCLKERLDLLADAELPSPVWSSFLHETQPYPPCSQLHFQGYGSSGQSFRSDGAPHSAHPSSSKSLKRTGNRGRIAEISHGHQLCTASSTSGIAVPTGAVHSSSSRSILDARRTLSGLESSAYKSAISSTDNSDMIPSSDACPVNRRNSLSFLLSIDDGEDRSAAKIRANRSGALTDKQSSASRSQRGCTHLGSLSDRFGLSSNDALFCGSNEERSASRLSSVTLGGGRKSGASWQAICREDSAWQPKRCSGKDCVPAEHSRHCCHECDNFKQPWQASRPSSWEGLWFEQPPKYSLSQDSAFLKTSGRASVFSRADVLRNSPFRRTAGIFCNGSHGPELGSERCRYTAPRHQSKNGRTYCLGEETADMKRSDDCSFCIRADLCNGEGGSKHMIYHDIEKCRDGDGKPGRRVNNGEDEGPNSMAAAEDGPFYSKFSSQRWQETAYPSKKNDFGGSTRYNTTGGEYFARRMLQDACTQTTPSRSSDAESQQDRKLPCHGHHHHHHHSTSCNVSATSSTPTLWHKLWSKTSKWASRHSRH